MKKSLTVVHTLTQNGTNLVIELTIALATQIKPATNPAKAKTTILLPKQLLPKE
jgi:hypothetical protein